MINQRNVNEVSDVVEPVMWNYSCSRNTSAN